MPTRPWRAARIAHVVAEVFETQFIEHAFLEPESALALPAADGSLQVFTQNQGVFDVRRQLARILALPEERLRVTLVAAGGAFGGKEDLTVQPYAALLAVRSGRPVKLTLSRQDSIRMHSKRHPMRLEYTVGCDEQGLLQALKVRLVGDKGAYASVGSKVVERAAGHATGAYAVPHVAVEALAVYTYNPPCGAMRGFGVNQTAFAIKGCLDRLAERVGLDGWEIRYRNALRDGAVAIPFIANPIWTMASRESTQTERAQATIICGGVSLVVAGAVVLEFGGLVGLPGPFWLPSTILMMALPVAIAAAIVYHRLFAIEVRFRKTLTYGLLATLLAVLYLGWSAGWRRWGAPPASTKWWAPSRSPPPLPPCGTSSAPGSIASSSARLTIRWPPWHALRQRPAPPAIPPSCREISARSCGTAWPPNRFASCGRIRRSRRFPAAGRDPAWQRNCALPWAARRRPPSGARGRLCRVLPERWRPSIIEYAKERLGSPRRRRGRRGHRLRARRQQVRPGDQAAACQGVAVGDPAGQAQAVDRRREGDQAAHRRRHPACRGARSDDARDARGPVRDGIRGPGL